MRGYRDLRCRLLLPTTTGDAPGVRLNVRVDFQGEEDVESGQGEPLWRMPVEFAVPADRAGNSNASPRVAALSVYARRRQCGEQRLEFAVSDPEGDPVRCRVATKEDQVS